jgi:hypothetical protein
VEVWAKGEMGKWGLTKKATPGKQLTLLLTLLTLLPY